MAGYIRYTGNSTPSFGKGMLYKIEYRPTGGYVVTSNLNEKVYVSELKCEHAGYSR